MKTAFLLSVLAFLAIGNIHSQDKDVEFARLHTRKLILKGQAVPSIYCVAFTQANNSIHPDYTRLQNELEKVMADSLSKMANYNKALDKFNDIALIKDKVIEFNTSDKPFGNKVSLLKDAQILASKHGMTDLFYSDNEINKSMKAGFLLLTLNPADMEAHLNKILARLDKVTAPERPSFLSSSELREKLSQVKISNGSMLQGDLVGPEELIGRFSIINSYYVLHTPANGFSKNQLVSKKMVSDAGIAKKHYFPQEKTLIQNKLTKEMYLVDTSFINQFSIQNERFL